MAGGNKGSAEQAKLRGDIISLPVAASTIIYRGTLVAIDATGGLVQAADTAGLKFVGVSEEKVDNSAGALAALSCRIRRRGIFRMKKNAVNATTDIGQVICAKTAQTATVDEDVDLSSAVTSNVRIGMCTAIDAVIGTSHFIWVELAPQVTGASGAGRATLAVTATATLTNAQLAVNPIINANHASVAIALTLPAAGAGNAGKEAYIGMGGAAAVTVICTAGFGGGGSGKDTVTLAQGDMCHVISDGTNWYVTNVTTSA